ncbi:MAG: succinate dehydrogenase/fumarate reductase iron-sulfur subunit [Gemmatimonadales bacterium]
MRITLKVWRQESPKVAGRFETYLANDVSPDMSFLEMMDVVNEDLTGQGRDPIAFDHDCREGICGMCSMVIDGTPHGPHKATTTCQLHMRSFSDGDTVTVEPFRARGFPIVRDLAVDRSALDRIIQAGGYVSVATGNAPDANSVPISKEAADRAMDVAQCIGCGACVAACPNASAMLFVGAKVSHLGLLPQGQPERYRRTLAMVTQMDIEEFGGCSNFGECEAACPKEIGVWAIARMNADFVKASASARNDAGSGSEGM